MAPKMFQQYRHLAPGQVPRGATSLSDEIFKLQEAAALTSRPVADRATDLSALAAAYEWETFESNFISSDAMRRQAESSANAIRSYRQAITLLAQAGGSPDLLAQARLSFAGFLVRSDDLKGADLLYRQIEASKPVLDVINGLGSKSEQADAAYAYGAFFLGKQGQERSAAGHYLYESLKLNRESGRTLHYAFGVSKLAELFPEVDYSQQSEYARQVLSAAVAGGPLKDNYFITKELSNLDRLEVEKKSAREEIQKLAHLGAGGAMLRVSDHYSAAYPIDNRDLQRYMDDFDQFGNPKEKAKKAEMGLGYKVIILLAYLTCPPIGMIVHWQINQSLKFAYQLEMEAAANGGVHPLSVRGLAEGR